MDDLLGADGYMRLKRCRYGYMLYNVNTLNVGRSLDLYGEYSGFEVRFLRKFVKLGDVVIDVGANIGALTVPLTRFVGPDGVVISLEPQPVLFHNLCANIALNGLTNARALKLGPGNRKGSVRLPNIDFSKPGLHGGHSIDGKGEGDIAQIGELDKAVKLNRCALIKIDVEGMEAEVLQGAQELIRQFQPVLYMENDRKEKSPNLINMLHGLGYSLYWHLPPLFKPNNFFSNEENIFGGIMSINMLCSPSRLRVTGMDGFKVDGPNDWWRDLTVKFDPLGFEDITIEPSG